MAQNRVRAEQHVDAAEKWLWEGDFKKAEEELIKAQQIYPTQNASALLNTLRWRKTSNRNLYPRSSDSMPREHPKVPTKNKEKESCAMSDSSYGYTQEQLDAVRRVKKCNNYYQLLGVDRFSSTKEIKKSYKKLALQFHPDKNKAPGAVEAFKKIGTAMSVLTNFEKRMEYDFYNGETLVSFSNRKANDTYPRDIWADIGLDGTPLKQFYRGDSHTSNSSGPKQEAKKESSTRSFVLLVILSVVLLMVFYLLSTWLTTRPIYSFSSDSMYRVQRNTRRLRVPYYVQDNFYDYQGSISELEILIEDEYLAILRNTCYQEMNENNFMVRKEQESYSDHGHDKTTTSVISSCSLLKKLQESSS